MKQALLIVVLSSFGIFALTGCALWRPKAKIDNTAGASALTSYSGPKARIAVADFEVRAAKATLDIGFGLREMLVAALINSNRFSVVERQSPAAVMQEQALSALGGAEAGSSPQRDKIKTADLIITVAVAEFEPQSSGGSAGVGGGGGVGSGILGGLLGATLNKAHLALDIRIIDASTSEALAAIRVQGQASDISGTVVTGLFDSTGLRNGLSIYAKTPMEKAVRICIIEALRYISQTTPVAYYKY